MEIDAENIKITLDFVRSSAHDWENADAIIKLLEDHSTKQ